MKGAQSIIKCLENLGVEHVFGIIGGAALNIFDALLESKIKLIMTRHEQGATHMADGYARSTGKPGVVFVTSGPGATNTVTGLMTAYMDSIPIIILCGQVDTLSLGQDAFQEADIFGITMPIVKHNYLVKSSNDLPRVIKEAFHIATTGRPGPVVIDLPKNITGGECTCDLDCPMDIPGYKIPQVEEDDPSIAKMALLFHNSKKPLILVGHGAVISNAQEEVIKLAEKLKAPVISTLLGKGCFPEHHSLSLGMCGMHGTPEANYAMTRCDLILSIGSRWDDRINGDNTKFCIGAKRLHIDIDPAEIDKIVKTDAHVIGDAKFVLSKLVNLVEPLNTASWLDDIIKYKNKSTISFEKEFPLYAKEVIFQLYELTKDRQPIVSTDVGQNQMWSAQFFKIDKNNHWLSSGGSGTMGYGMPAAVGAQLANPDKMVISISGDGGFQMTMSELATAQNNKLPIKMVILDNTYLGMVRQWQELFFKNRLSGVHLEGNPDFVKIAASYGIKGFRIDDRSQLIDVLKEAVEYNDGPCVIHALVKAEDNVFPMIPAGKSAHDILLAKPQ